MPWFTALPFLHLINFSVCNVYHSARFEKDTRYYALYLQQDLLGDWTVVAINGRIKSKLGQSRTLAFSNYDEAFQQFCTMANIRYQRGYQCISYWCDAHLFIHLIVRVSPNKPSIFVAPQRRITAEKQVTQRKTKPSQLTTHQQMPLFLN
jgi:hypothetical protein